MSPGRASEAVHVVGGREQAHPLGRDAQIIGTVTDAHPGLVAMRTVIGAMRVVDMLAGDELPWIC